MSRMEPADVARIDQSSMKTNQLIDIMIVQIQGLRSEGEDDADIAGNLLSAFGDDADLRDRATTGFVFALLRLARVVPGRSEP